jgi:hypothetical protein
MGCHPTGTLPAVAAAVRWSQVRHVVGKFRVFGDGQDVVNGVGTRL